MDGEVSSCDVRLMISRLKLLSQSLLGLLDQIDVISGLDNVVFSISRVLVDGKSDVGMDQDSDDKQWPEEEAKDEPCQSVHHRGIENGVRDGD